MSNPASLPKYVQTSEMLARDIAAGRLIAGERLPPEREMAASLGIAVGTLRRALADLTERGLIERVQGSGNYVRSSAEATGIYALFRLELTDGGGLPTAEILSVAREAKPEDAPAFGSAPHAHRIRRHRRLSGQSAALEEIWFDCGRAASIKAEDLSESLYLFYRKKLGIWIARAEDAIGVGKVPEWTVPAFGLASGTTCGFVERLAWDQDGNVVEYSRTWFDPRSIRYVTRLK